MEITVNGILYVNFGSIYQDVTGWRWNDGWNWVLVSERKGRELDYLWEKQEARRLEGKK